LGFRYAGKLNLAGGQQWFYSAELAQQAAWRAAPDAGAVGYSTLETGMRRRGHAACIGSIHGPATVAGPCRPRWRPRTPSTAGLTVFSLHRPMAWKTAN